MNDEVLTGSAVVWDYVKTLRYPTTLFVLSYMGVDLHKKSGEGDHGQNIKRMSVWRIRTVVKKTYKQIRFTERCTLGQSAVLRSHVVCPSVCL